METKWSEQQKKAIETVGRRLLVSAAAGSGKTAVLVERVIRRVLDPRDPVDVDQLLVMTFTRAAASEMRAKIRRALEQAGRTDQVAILESASIQTIDSFCANVVRDHTDRLNLDPALRIAEEAELHLLRRDVLEEMLEDCFETGDEDFLDFVECYTTGSGAANLEEILLSLFDFAQAQPDPYVWYEQQLREDGKEYYTYLYQAVRRRIGTLCHQMELALSLAEAHTVPDGYVPALEQELSRLELLRECPSPESLRQGLLSMEFVKRMPAAKKTEAYDFEEIERIKKIRDSVKKQVRETLISLVQAPDTNPHAATAVGLTREFNQRFDEAKRRKNIVDFSDLEHMTLQVLRECPDVADEYRSRFREIYIDEFQDSNRIQEELVSLLDCGQVFMVGDVKQSIYRFRMARPEIFMEKYTCYAPYETAGPGDDTVIDLSENYRSRPAVLDSVNALFRAVMTRELGGVDYDEKAALHAGLSWAEAGAPAELLLADVSAKDSSEENATLEARMIAGKIRELRTENPDLRFGDVVILLRSANALGNLYREALAEEGIPAYCETNRGYFDSVEVRTVLAALEVIDNPRREIARAAVLKSPIIGMTDDELAKGDPDSFRMRKYEELRSRFAERAGYLGIPVLLEKFYDETGYEAYVSALPGGAVRRGNLQKLRQMADEYARTGYRGLYQFLRYVADLKEYDTDFGEAGAAGSGEDAVRIMSIHKSKGLQFPVCFVSALSRQINFRDGRAPVLTDPDLGVACTDVDPVARTRQSTLKHNAIRCKMEADTLSEELRILYVAMTRAQDRLILTGTVTDPAKIYAAYEVPELLESTQARSMLDWILASGARYPLSVISGEDRTAEDPADEKRLERLREFLDTAQISPEERDVWEEKICRPYAWEADVALHAKVSVSELKRRWQQSVMTDPEMKADGMLLIADAKKEKEMPLTGADRGSLYHQVWQQMDYTDPKAYYDALPAEVRKVVRWKDLETFLSSDLGQAFRRAAVAGTLFRERKFLLSLPARELQMGESEEPVLIQGIMDAYFETEGELWLVDYKTDRVREEEELIQRYRIQLELYAKALEKIRGRTVSRKILWSVALGRAIDV